MFYILFNEAFALKVQVHRCNLHSGTAASAHLFFLRYKRRLRLRNEYMRVITRIYEQIDHWFQLHKTNFKLSYLIYFVFSLFICLDCVLVFFHIRLSSCSFTCLCLTDNKYGALFKPTGVLLAVTFSCNMYVIMQNQITLLNSFLFHQLRSK